jgi:fructose-bisphosphate aldolase class I
MSDLHEIAKAMVATPRGILAIDESTGTCAKRFAEAGIECTEETRRQYRELLVTTKGLGQYISGAILYKETLFQNASDGTPLVRCLERERVIPGIKVDEGLEKQPNGEELTKGLDTLAASLAKYKAAGARFSKWRAVIHIGQGIPTKENMHESARRLAAYAKECQRQGIVPITEPEVLMDGDHTIERCAHVTTDILMALFSELAKAGVDLKGMVLKPNMIAPGKEHAKATPAQVAEATLKVLKACVPKDVPGIAFLSGGIGDEDITRYLNTMAKLGPHPWKLTFSFGRGLQRGALKAFAKGDIAGGQKELLARSRDSSLATQGKYA